jgi:hypothetical protein
MFVQPYLSCKCVQNMWTSVTFSFVNVSWVFTIPWRCSKYLNSSSNSLCMLNVHHAMEVFTIFEQLFHILSVCSVFTMPWRCSTYLNICSNSLCMFNVHHAMEVFKIFEHRFTFSISVQPYIICECVQNIWKSVHNHCGYSVLTICHEGVYNIWTSVQIQYVCSTLPKLQMFSKYLNICSHSLCMFNLNDAVKVFKT